MGRLCVKDGNKFNVLCMLILITVLMVLLSMDSQKGLKVKQRIYGKTALRQLKGLIELPDTTDQSIADTKARIKPKDVPLIYTVTPTYYRLTQMADLTRLANTLRNVRRLHWIVVEDWTFTNHNVHDLLQTSNISFTYIAQAKRKSSNASKGNDQKNAAIQWITKNHRFGEPAVVYFADDDNTYDLRLFEEMRYTKKLSMWPVGFSGKMRLEKPIVKDGKVTNFSAWWSNHRVFPVDMAGFAINTDVLWNYYPMRFETIVPADTCCMAETHFLEQCCTREEIEPKADNCTKVYVWHTKTVKPGLKVDQSKYEEIYV
ncbi:galactosylgalactosylxylosylprotein 3-beta-glucuronosyltransferase 2-like [Mytilus californianus]|uniref:galactosylgalactosylxylosylprotein 3-beta-glucuronosyltransferase 2-like n=1 Tax=Mytilus californianus TaxID=6549 RepID=UPI0022459451|nr:galactosylgalactosylxylosylprotein 3-beta-glucuronosyltransferase 2-like [Mytilus californianus]